MTTKYRLLYKTHKDTIGYREFYSYNLALGFFLDLRKQGKEAWIIKREVFFNEPIHEKV